MNPQIEKHENDVITIDTGYIRKGFAASHLVKEKTHGVFIDTGTTHSLDHFLKVLEQEKIPTENVEYELTDVLYKPHEYQIRSRCCKRLHYWYRPKKISENNNTNNNP